MTVSKLIADLSEFCRSKTAHFSLPVPVQKNDTEALFIAPNVYKQRLPSINDYEKHSPFILVQYLKGGQRQKEGQRPQATAEIRITVCIYNRDNEEEGSLALINVISSIKQGLLTQVVVGEQFILDVDAGIEDEVYPDNTAPYFIGDIYGKFLLPPIEREVYFG